MAPFFGWKDSLNAKGSFVRAAVARFFLCQISAKINSPTRFLLFLFTANLVCSDKRLCYELCTGHRFRIKLQKTFSFTVFLSQASYILWAVLLAAGVFLMLCKKNYHLSSWYGGADHSSDCKMVELAVIIQMYNHCQLVKEWQIKGESQHKVSKWSVVPPCVSKRPSVCLGRWFHNSLLQWWKPFSPHLMLWWAPPDIKVQNLSLGVHLGCNLVTMKKIPVIFLLSIDLQWPFHLMGEVGLV